MTDSKSVLNIMSYSLRFIATAKYKILNNFMRSRVLLEPCSNSSWLKGQSVFLHNSSPSGGTSTRFRNHRRRHGNHRSTSGKTLLDKFIKQLSYDGGMFLERIVVFIKERVHSLSSQFTFFALIFNKAKRL